VVFVLTLAAAVVAALSTPGPSPSPVPSPQLAAAWIAAHLPASYDENLAGTTNTIAAEYSAAGCAITVSVSYSWQFNTLGRTDKSRAFSVKGDVLPGHHFQASDDGGTVDFSLVDASSLRVSNTPEYLGAERVTQGGFEFTYRNEADANAMLGEIASLARACAAAKGSSASL
jgi:hypothetical protein